MWTLNKLLAMPRIYLFLPLTNKWVSPCDLLSKVEIGCNSKVNDEAEEHQHWNESLLWKDSKSIKTSKATKGIICAMTHQQSLDFEQASQKALTCKFSFLCHCRLLDWSTNSPPTLCDTQWQSRWPLPQRGRVDRESTRCQSSWCQRWGASSPSCWWRWWSTQAS